MSPWRRPDTIVGRLRYRRRIDVGQTDHPEELNLGSGNDMYHLTDLDMLLERSDLSYEGGEC